jgi:hypothetical protein
MSDQLSNPAGKTTLALAAADANVADEGRAAGVSFGTLIQTTGNAVASTQSALNDSSAATATALATTLVDVIALQERIYDDQGNVVDAQSHVLKLPLITFIDPVFYQWSSVRLQGYFYANEFASDTTISTSVVTTNTSAGGASVLGFTFGSGKFSLGATRTDLEVESSSDTSFGLVRMNALLEPRRDVAIPKPTQVIQGPSLAIIQGEIVNDPPTGTPTSRSMSLLIEYRRRDGSPIPAKSISIETNGVAWSFDSDPAVTDAEGHLSLTLNRTFIAATGEGAEPPDTSAQDFVISARIGLVQNSTTVRF